MYEYNNIVIHCHLNKNSDQFDVIRPIPMVILYSVPNQPITVESYVLSNVCM